MNLKDIVHQHHTALTSHYAARLSSHQRHALKAIRRCRTPDAGELQLRCTDCEQQRQQPLSCGHRSCPACQNHEASQWLDRQHAKLLPVDYFMATFTLPYELRALAWRHQTTVYRLFFASVISTLKTFALNPKSLGADLGMTAVLHTHSRRLDYHPHIHVVVPGGGIDTRRRQWKKTKGKYLFNACALATVFRARFITALKDVHLTLPDDLPTQWVVDCRHVGKGESALKYLARYLYRGVISENNIIANQDGKVTFRYTESKTGHTTTRTLKGEDFLWLVLQHVLPKGFRRVRDYGFLHGNAKKRLSLVQLVLKVMINRTTPRPRPVFTCAHCQAPMVIVGLLRHHWQSG